MKDRLKKLWKDRKWLVVAVAALVLISPCVCCEIFTALEDVSAPIPAVTSTATITPISTPTAVPTLAPTRTRTPILELLTATPVPVTPTNTSMPTEAPTATTVLVPPTITAVPIAEPTVPLLPTGTPTVEPTNTPTIAAGPVPVCDCSYNRYNCPDFDTQVQAQKCYDYCQAQGCGDIHELDADSDNLACESLP